MAYDTFPTPSPDPDYTGSILRRVLAGPSPYHGAWAMYGTRHHMLDRKGRLRDEYAYDYAHGLLVVPGTEYGDHTSLPWANRVNVRAIFDHYDHDDRLTDCLSEIRMEGYGAGCLVLDMDAVRTQCANIRAEHGFTDAHDFVVDVHAFIEEVHGMVNGNGIWCHSTLDRARQTAIEANWETWASEDIVREALDEVADEIEIPFGMRFDKPAVLKAAVEERDSLLEVGSAEWIFEPNGPFLVGQDTIASWLADRVREDPDRFMEDDPQFVAGTPEYATRQAFNARTSARNRARARAMGIVPA